MDCETPRESIEWTSVLNVLYQTGNHLAKRCMLNIPGEISIDMWITPGNTTAWRWIRRARCIKHVRSAPKVLKLVFQ
jgi:hypothetical protein